MSRLEQALADYLQLHRSLGHDLVEAGWLLPGFVAYLDAHSLSTVTIEAALAWAQQAPLSPTGRITTVGPRRCSITSGAVRTRASALCSRAHLLGVPGSDTTTRRVSRRPGRPRPGR